MEVKTIKTRDLIQEIILFNINVMKYRSSRCNKGAKDKHSHEIECDSLINEKCTGGANTGNFMQALSRWSAIVDGLDKWIGFGEVLSVVFDKLVGPLAVLTTSLSALLRSTALTGEKTARAVALEAVANIFLSRTDLAGFVVHR